MNEGEKTSDRNVNVITSSKSLLFNFYVVVDSTTRGSRSQIFFRKDILKNVAKFTGKQRL